MNIHAGLLFLHGHITDPELARSLAGNADDDRPGREPERRPAPRKGATPPRDRASRPFRRGAIVSIGSVALSPFR